MAAPLGGVVFDLDGTLILSHHDFARMRRAIVESASRYGVPAASIARAETVGTSETMAAAHEALAAIDPSGATTARFDRECAERVDAIEREAVERSTPRPGALDLLTSLGKAHLTLGLFTRSSEAFCEEVLVRLGWQELFAHRRTRSASGPAKPSPEALRRLLEEMRLLPEETVYVGDHPEDARCASALGVAFCAVLPAPGEPAPFGVRDFAELGAAAVVATLSEVVAVPRIAERLARAPSATPEAARPSRPSGIPVDGPCTLRRARDTDIPGLLSCLRAAFEPFRAQYTPAAWTDTTLTESSAGDRLRTMRVWVAVDARGKVRGTVSWGTESTTRGHLRGMAVEPGSQGSGLAQRLLDRALEEAGAEGIRTVTLETTEPLGRARGFYRRNGFRRTGAVRDYYGMPLWEFAREIEPGTPP